MVCVLQFRCAAHTRTALKKLQTPHRIDRAGSDRHAHRADIALRNGRLIAFGPVSGLIGGCTPGLPPSHAGAQWLKWQA